MRFCSASGAAQFGLQKDITLSLPLAVDCGSRRAARFWTSPAAIEQNPSESGDLDRSGSQETVDPCTFSRKDPCALNPW